MIAFDEKTYEIKMTQYDFGIPIVLDAGKNEGFNVGDRIVFVFKTDRISNKIFDVDIDEYKVNLVFDQEEVDGLFDQDISTYKTLRYSIKRYRWNDETQKYEFLESLANDNDDTIFRLRVEGTVKYNGETESS